MIYFAINCLATHITAKYSPNFCHAVSVSYFDNGEIFGVALLLLKPLKIASFPVAIYGLSADILSRIWHIWPNLTR